MLIQAPFVPHQQHQVALTLGLTDASVQRGLKTLIAEDLAVKKRKQYAVNLGHVATKYLWLLRQVERELALPIEVRHALGEVVESDRMRHAIVVLFGSWAQSSASLLDSDIDIAVFSDSLPQGNERSFSGRFTVDLHRFSEGELHGLTNSAALDALLNGIPLTRREVVFDAATQVRTFPKAFLVYRLNQADAQLMRSTFLEESVQPEAAAVFREMAERTAGQILNILEQGRPESWRTMKKGLSAEDLIEDAREKLASEGSQVWLT